MPPFGVEMIRAIPGRGWSCWVLGYATPYTHNYQYIGTYRQFYH
jgi:hypothetical protein